MSSETVVPLSSPQAPDLELVLPATPSPTGAPRRVRAATVATGVLASVDAVAAGGAALIAGGDALLALAFAASALLMVRLSGAYAPRFRLRALEDAPRILGHFAVLGLAAVAVDATSVSIGTLTLQAGLTAVLILAGRGVSTATIRALRRRGRLTDNLVMVGTGEVAGTIVKALKADRSYGLKPVGCLDGACAGTGVPHLGDVSDLAKVAVEHNVASIVVAFSQTREGDMVDLLRTAVMHGIDVYVVPRFFDIGTALSGDGADEIWGIPIYPVRRGRRLVARAAKRGIDLLVAAVAGLLLSPLLAAVALGVRLTSSGPVLYRQMRVGQHGREFPMLKFRTLYVDACSDTQWSTSAADTQTPVGKLLRRTNLDELPQLWNILRGDMSLIGPRPERTHFVREFWNTVPGYAARHRVPVGLTGWAQVNGLRGDMRIEERARFDNRYIENWSPWRDVLILLRTVAAVLRPSP